MPIVAGSTSSFDSALFQLRSTGSVNHLGTIVKILFLYDRYLSTDAYVGCLLFLGALDKNSVF